MTRRAVRVARKRHKFNIKSIMDDGEGNWKDNQDSFFDKFDHADLDDARRVDRLQMNGGVGGGEIELDASRDWLNDRLFEKDDSMLELGSGNDGVSTAQGFGPQSTRFQ